jgi:hypothetical protein
MNKKLRTERTIRRTNWRKTPRDFCEFLQSIKTSMKRRSHGICESQCCNNVAN